MGVDNAHRVEVQHGGVDTGLTETPCDGECAIVGGIHSDCRIGDDMAVGHRASWSLMKKPVPVATPLQ